MIEKNAKIYVAGHKGMVGSAIVRELERQGYHNIITRTHKELDLLRQDAVEAFSQRKSRKSWFWRQQRSAESSRMNQPWLISCTTT